MQKTAPLRRGCFLSRAPAHPAARHTRASRCPPCLCVPLPAMPVRPVTRHTDALRRPPYWRGPLLPAGSYRRPPCRRSPQYAVPVRPINRRADSYRRPPRPCVPPTAAPVYFAAAKPVYTAAKPPALSRSAVKDTHSIFILRQESPLHIPFYGNELNCETPCQYSFFAH